MAHLTIVVSPNLKFLGLSIFKILQFKISCFVIFDNAYCSYVLGKDKVICHWKRHAYLPLGPSTFLLKGITVLNMLHFLFIFSFVG